MKTLEISLIDLGIAADNLGENTDAVERELGCSYIREVAPRYLGPRRKLEVIGEASDAARFFRGILRDNAREHVLAIYLNGANRPIAYSIVHIGTANSSTVHPREVFQCGLLAGACALILGHNHPSGELDVSESDRKVTRAIHEAGKILGVKLLDHVVFTDNGHWSFQEHGQMPE